MAAMRSAGATLVPVEIFDLADLTTDTALSHFESREACDRYFESLGPAAPVASLATLLATGTLHPFVRDEVEADLAVIDGTRMEEYRRRLGRREDLRRAVLTAMATEGLEAILYPQQRRLVANIGEAQLERNGVLSNATGLPALTLPGGFSEPTESAPLGVPVGLELLGIEWSEPTLLRLGFAFEQATRFRRSPASTPALGREV
jgi:amidase